MNPDEQRIELAKMDGWQRKGTLGLAKYPAYVHTDGRRCTFVQLPRYLSDLNAIHAVELKLAYPNRYAKLLIGVVAGDLTRSYGPDGEIEYSNHFAIFTATAAQRAEALLRTVGKWKD